jgi:hypothetical protein
MGVLRRFATYGVGGWVFEVVFTGVKGPVRDRDWRLASHTYLWMFPVYGAAGLLFERVHDALAERPMWQRGLAYTAGSYAVEAASGEAIRRAVGEVPWDYARPRRADGKVPRHVAGLVRPAYAPVWFAAGLAFEQLDRRLR